MTIGDGARGVEKGATVTVRDIRALRVKLLNHVKLAEHIGGHTDEILGELNCIGVTDDDKRTLLTRSIAMLHEIAATTGLKSSVRWRAAKTINETIVELTKDRTKARIASATLAQQSNEHADKVKLKERELDISEGMGPPGQQGAALGSISTENLKGMLDATPPNANAHAPADP